MEMTNLRDLLGTDWVDANIVRNKSSHRLGQWYRRNPDDPWLSYTEKLVKDVLTNRHITLVHETLAKKLKAKGDFVPTLSEMESALLLANQCCDITLEPTAPASGPDIRADLNGVSYFVEIRTVGLSDEDTRRDAVTNQIFEALNKKPSTFRVALTVGQEYRRGTKRLADAIKALLTSIDSLQTYGAKEGKLYFSNLNEAVLVMPGANLNEKHHAIMKKADLTAKFSHAGAPQRGTPASLMQPRKDPLEPVKDHERLKRILEQKRSQLPKGQRGIIVLEVSEIFVLSEFSIERALYGDMVIQFRRGSGPEEPVGPVEQSRNNRGFLLHTSRVSAVVIQKRTIQGNEISNEWRVCPTNRGTDDTIRLTLTELRMFGDVEDRDHLTAEHAPNCI